MKPRIFPLLLQTFLLSYSVDATGTEAGSQASPGLAECIKEFVQVIASINAFGLNHNYARYIKEIIVKLDNEILEKTKEQVNLKIYNHSFRRDLMRTLNELYIWEEKYQGREAPPDLLEFQRSSVQLGNHYHQLNLKLDIDTALLDVTKRIRSIMYQDLNVKTTMIRATNLKPGERLPSDRNSDKVLHRLAPFVETALEYTRSSIVIYDKLKLFQAEAEQKQIENAVPPGEDNFSQETSDSQIESSETDPLPGSHLDQSDNSLDEDAGPQSEKDEYRRQLAKFYNVPEKDVYEAAIKRIDRVGNNPTAPSKTGNRKEPRNSESTNTMEVDRDEL